MAMFITIMKTVDTTLFYEEILKRLPEPIHAGDYEKFLALWEPQEVKRNEMIMNAGEVPKCTVFGLNG